MGPPQFWTEALGLFKHRPHEKISGNQYPKVGFDLDILMNKSRTDITGYATTNDPKYASPDILKRVEEYHRQIINAGVEPIYVYGGPAPLIKKEEKERRLRTREVAANSWIEVLNQLGEDPEYPLSENIIHEAVESRKKLSHPTVLDHANVLSWMKKEGICVVGSYLEADQQLRKLEMDRIVDAIATEDGDLVVLGGETVLSKSMTRGGELQFRIFKKEELRQTTDTDLRLSKFFRYEEARIDIALLFGMDYVEKVENNGPVTVLDDQDKARNKTTSKRFDDGLIDSLAQHIDGGRNPEEWYEEYAKRYKDKLRKSDDSQMSPDELADEYARRLIMARRYLLHAPVFEKNGATGEISLVPLYPLPDGISNINEWKEYIGFDFGMDAVVGQLQYKDAYDCNVVPLTGLLPTQHRGPLFTREDNPTVSTNEVLPLFGRLHFDAVPVALHPTIVLTYWLKARGWIERDSDNRDTIEQTVNIYRTIPRFVCPPEMQLTVGEYNSMEVLTHRTANNKYDTWCNDYHGVCKMVGTIDDNAVDPQVVALVPNSQRRACLLVYGYHYNPKSIRCKNVSSRINDSPCILLCVECLGSKKTWHTVNGKTVKLIHTVHAVFEDKPGGRFLLSPYSTCSCDQGALFCSHMLGFLYLLGLAQDEPSQDAFEKWYVARQELLLAAGALAETVVMMDKFKREIAQSARQAKRK